MIRVPDSFHTHSQGQVITPTVDLQVSFTREKDSSITYFTLDSSALNGTDILSPSEDNPIQLWDTYIYDDYTDRLVRAEWSRSVEWPYGTQSALADIDMDNTDGLFSPNSGSTIAQYLIPKRPLRLFGGYYGDGLVSQFVGLSQGMMELSSQNRTASFHAMDFLYEIGEQTLNDVVVARNVTTDKVLAAVVEQFGVLPSQFSFETGLNVIPFVFFDKGANAGDVIRKLVQAENGKFWQDEQGQLRFEARARKIDQPVMVIPKYSIMRIEPTERSGIVNRVKINALMREVQEYQAVYNKTSSEDTVSTNLWVIPARGTYTIDAGLEDPCYDIQPPTQGRASTVSWFTTRRSNQTIINTGVTATGVLSSNSYRLTFTNTNNFPVEVDELVLWGEPAKVIDEITYDAYDEDSVAKYGEQVLEISDNEFFQTYAQCDYFATIILRERSEYLSELTLEIKGDFALQLGDIIVLQDEYAGQYVVDSLSYSFSGGYLATTLVCHKYDPISYFVLDESKLNGEDVLG